MWQTILSPFSFNRENLEVDNQIIVKAEDLEEKRSESLIEIENLECEESSSSNENENQVLAEVRDKT